MSTSNISQDQDANYKCSRLIQIIKYSVQHYRRKKKREISIKQACAMFAEECKIPLKSVLDCVKHEILPSPEELRKIMVNKEWKLWFVFHISEHYYKKKMLIFFAYLGILHPNPRNQLLFYKIYRELLIIRYSDKRGDNNEE